VLVVAQAVKKPHVLFIVIDDLGFDDVGFRSHQIRTPTIDAWAKDGIILDQYYVQDVCSPSRATFQTGRFAMHHSIVDWIPPASAYGLPLNETTMAEKFQEAGYETHASGKWHLGFYKWEMTPTFRGFNSFVGFYSGGEDYFTHESSGAYDFRRDLSPRCGKNCSTIASADKGSYSTTVFSERAVEVIQQHKNPETTPLFLYLAYQGVHAPSEVPQSYEDAYDETIPFEPSRRKFAGMLSCVDEGIANVSKALTARDMLKDTFIVFTTDNGGPTTTGDGVGARNWPLKGGKHSIWEGGTRGVAFLHGPTWLMKKTGYTYTGLMHGADWLPTLADVAGFSLNGTLLPAPLNTLKPQLPVDGVSQWAAFNGNSVHAEYDEQGGEGMQGVQRGGQVGPRSQLVYGNSTNACSWEEMEDEEGHPDPRLAKYTDSKLHGPANGAKIGCGFGVRDGEWKLIRGYGGGPDTWCNRTGNNSVPDPSGPKGFSCANFSSFSSSTSGVDTDGVIAATAKKGAVDGGTTLSTSAKCATRTNTCSDGKGLTGGFVSNTTDGSDCCAACTAAKGCVGWILHHSDMMCYIKSSWGHVRSCTASMAGAGTTPVPPTPAPVPSTECPNGYCLFNVNSDPNEHEEVSAAHPDVVKKMIAQMDQVLKTYTQYKADASCPKVAYANDPVVGKTWQPWC
jgi:arylsulfatase A-like enzyme